MDRHPVWHVLRSLILEANPTLTNVRVDKMIDKYIRKVLLESRQNGKH